MKPSSKEESSIGDKHQPGCFNWWPSFCSWADDELTGLTHRGAITRASIVFCVVQIACLAVTLSDPVERNLSSEITHNLKPDQWLIKRSLPYNMKLENFKIALASIWTVQIVLAVGQILVVNFMTASFMKWFCQFWMAVSNLLYMVQAIISFTEVPVWIQTETLKKHHAYLFTTTIVSQVLLYFATIMTGWIVSQFLRHPDSYAINPRNYESKETPLDRILRSNE